MLAMQSARGSWRMSCARLVPCVPSWRRSDGRCSGGWSAGAAWTWAGVRDPHDSLTLGPLRVVSIPSKVSAFFCLYIGHAF